jgi:hypothetical protein
MASDSKLARNLSTAIARVATAIHRAAANPNHSSAVVPELRSGCKEAIKAARAAGLGMSARYQKHAALLMAPISTACTSVNLASAATDNGAHAHLLDQAQAAIALALEGAQALQSEIAPVKAHGVTMDGLDFLGADDGSDSGGGFVSDIFKTVGGLAKGAVSYAQGEKAKGDAATDADAKLQAAISADGTATMAVAQALMSSDAASRDPSKADAALADKMMADSAVQAQDVAGAAVPDSAKAKRVAAAQKTVTDAQAGLAAALKGGSAPAKIAAKFTLQAAQQTLTKAQGGGAITKGGQQQPVEDSGGGALAWLKTKTGPLPRYAYGLIGAGGYVGYRLLFKRKSS